MNTPLVDDKRWVVDYVFSRVFYLVFESDVSNNYWMLSILGFTPRSDKKGSVLWLLQNHFKVRNIEWMC
jgi:hypothetical protein